MAEPATMRPWAALCAMLVGYFMTLIDWTAVSVANPSIMTALHTDYDSVVWGTRHYLLGVAVVWAVRFHSDAGGGAGRPGHRSRVPHPASVVDDHPHLPGRAARRRNECAGI